MEAPSARSLTHSTLGLSHLPQGSAVRTARQSVAMAAPSSRASLALLLMLLVLLVVSTTFVSANGGGGRLRPSDCYPKCTYRCSATSHRKPCMFFCLKCCAKCLCVPPGTYGNRQVCPCYDNWKTQQGGPKCP